MTHTLVSGEPAWLPRNSNSLASQVHLVLSQTSTLSSSDCVQKVDRGTGETGSPHIEMELQEMFSLIKLSVLQSWELVLQIKYLSSAKTSAKNWVKNYKNRGSLSSNSSLHTFNKGD